ncbi:helix-turn-helix domain-containing protein [Nocardia canadensis]|uniref:helix-turn-helix domain-containing protein n=1 Tax=Nocardia canadensis TaxID=3065238 RepID=UPI00292EEA83|nr:helix-turn-helix domain-containing protein [Nocardia canadensis]
MKAKNFPHFDRRWNVENTASETRNLISLKTAASLIDVDSKTIRNWIASGDIAGYRINGRLLRVDRSELLALVRPAQLAQGGVA